MSTRNHTSMADIQFQEDTFVRRGDYVAPSRGWSPLALVMRFGLAKTAQGANYVLLVVLVLAVAGIVYVAMGANGTNGTLTQAQQSQVNETQAAMKSAGLIR